MQTSSGESIQYIIDSILDYIERDKTSYAILLNGKWGSGKTYFWENVLKEKIEKKTIYVSLYGINSTEEISKRIALGRWENVQKLNESKLGGRMTELAKATFGILKSVEIPFVKEMTLPKIDFDQFFDYTNTVLCFDDLERASIDINDVLGYINNFVEHDGIKVILIANENEIEAKLNDKNSELKMLTTCFYTDAKGEFNQKKDPNSHQEQIPINDLISRNLRDLFQNKNEYKRIKEKLIGKTLTIQLDEKVLIEDIVVQTSNEKQDLQKFLEDNLATIEDTYRESDSKNIRILKQALEDFDLIYQHCKECGYKSDTMLKSILKFVLAASFEIKTNIPRNEELEGVNSHDDFITEISLSSIMAGKAKPFLGEFQKKYYNGQGTLYKRKFLKFAEVLIRKGIFNKQLFKEEMDSFQLELDGIKNTDPHIAFIRDGFWELSDADFEVVEQSTYNKLKNGELHFTWYFRAYRMYEFFVENKMVTKNIADIKQEFMDGLDKSGEKGEYTEYTNSMFYMEEDLNNEHLNDFKNKIIEINNALKLEKEKENAPKLWELMRTDSYNFYIKMREQYIHTPFFVYLNPEELYESIINLSGEDIKTVRSLIKQRIQLVDDNFYSNLQKDLPNLMIIKSRLNDEINSRTKTPRLVLLEYLIKDIKKFEKKVNSLNTINESTL
ncbi:P-loop NTPase fold protein [Bacillus thuringiensis]|uniref:P-loop NTPase fold protein n=1 Tax=Bacillus thuringiensis TaxID=1428 RepID=UPI002079F22E|nr:P-loop NTPase fold protein [Bacillus thuringiensis]USL15811.1 KAP family NTPase [Bacillus thuringiensis]